jgi:hypothetical protein
VTVTSPECFRGLLRSKLAEGREMVWRVSRAGQIMEVRVACQD